MRPDTAGGRSRDGSLWFHQTCKKIKKFTSLVTTEVNRASNVGDPHYFHADPDPDFLFHADPNGGGDNTLPVRFLP